MDLNYDQMTQMERKKLERDELEKAVDQYLKGGGTIKRLESRSPQEIIRAGRADYGQGRFNTALNY